MLSAWDQIASDLHFSRRWVLNKHDRACEKGWTGCWRNGRHSMSYFEAKDDGIPFEQRPYKADDLLIRLAAFCGAPVRSWSYLRNHSSTPARNAAKKLFRRNR